MCKRIEGSLVEQIILIRFGEIFLKGKNRGFFEKQLLANIKEGFKKNKVKCNLVSLQNRYYVTAFNEEEIENIVDVLKSTFGIHSFSLGYKTKYKDCEFKEVLDILKNYASEKHSYGEDKGKTFRISANRAMKKIPMSSSDISAYLAKGILANSDMKVSLKKFDYEYKIDIRENGDIFVFDNIQMGQGGLPVGSSSKGFLLLSGGIDSPVAGYMMAKRGMEISAIHFVSPPYTSDGAKNKVIKLKKIISKYCTDITLYIVPFTEIQMAIHKYCPPEYMITIMRRFMMRIANKVASQQKIPAIITGESLGQVASQTVESMMSTQDASELPIFRPVIGMDKNEIIDIAKEIDTYETSILPFDDCCTVFLPKNPVIHPSLNHVIELEKEIPNLDELITNSIDGMEIV